MAMKFQYILIHLIFISIFGLLSCKSDSNPDQSNDPPDKIRVLPNQVRIINPDESFLETKDLKSISVNTLIKLTDDIITKVDNITSESTCRSSLRQNILTYESTEHKNKKVFIYQILNPNNFAPSEDTETITCDLKVQFNLTTKQNVIVKLDNIEIKGIQNFSNYNWEHLDKNNKTYLRFSNLTGLKLNIDSNEADINTICETGSSQFFFNNSSIEKGDLFPEHLFENKNLKHCRLHIKDLTNNNTFISRSFYIQYKEPEIVINTQTNAPWQSSFNVVEHNLVKVSIYNNGQVPAYLELPEDTSAKISIMPIYHNLSKKFTYRAKTQTQNTSWEYSRTDAKSIFEGKKLLKLSPGESLEIYLKLSANLRCQKILATGGGYCSEKPVLIGYHYLFPKVPQIRLSLYSDPNVNVWGNLNIKLSKSGKHGSLAHIWSPNQNVTKTCMYLTKIPTSKIPSHFFAFSKAQHCQFEVN